MSAHGHHASVQANATRPVEGYAYYIQCSMKHGIAIVESPERDDWINMCVRVRGVGERGTWKMTRGGGPVIERTGERTGERISQCERQCAAKRGESGE